MFHQSVLSSAVSGPARHGSHGFRGRCHDRQAVKEVLSGSIIGPPPGYVSAVADSEFTTKADRRFMEAGGELREIAVVGVNEIAQMVIQAWKAYTCSARTRSALSKLFSQWSRP